MITLSFSKSILEKLQKNLEIALALSNIRLYRLAHALLWHSEGKSIKQIAELIGVCAKTIMTWLKTLCAKALPG